MKRHWAKRSWILALTVTVLGTLVTACSSGGAGSTDANASLQRVISSGELRYGVVNGNPPGFIQGSNGEWHGYLADMAQKIANDLKLKPVPVETTWNNAVLDLQSGKIDIMTGVQPTGARALVVDFTSQPLYTNYYAALARPGVAAKSWSDLDKGSVKLGVVTGTSPASLANLFVPNSKIVGFPGQQEALLALQNGQVDAMIFTLFSSLSAMQQFKGLKAKIFVPEPTVTAPSAAMVARTADKSLLSAVNTEIWNLTSSGYNRSLIFKYLRADGVNLDDIPSGITI